MPGSMPPEASAGAGANMPARTIHIRNDPGLATVAKKMSPTRRKPTDPEDAGREHPTRTLLVDTARSLLADNAADTITADMVVSTSGVSKGSLYHFFEDLDDLLGTAMVREFSMVVRRNTAMAREAMARCDSTGSLQAVFDTIARDVRTLAVRRNRMNRINLVAFSRGHEKFQRLLAAEQSRLTGAAAELFALAQQRGWLRDDFDPRAGAVLFQACHFGQVVDEITDEPLADEVWLRMMDTFIRRVFVPSV